MVSSIAKKHHHIRPTTPRRKRSPPHSPRKSLVSSSSSSVTTVSSPRQQQQPRLTKDLINHLQRLHFVIDLDATFVSSNVSMAAHGRLARLLNKGSPPQHHHILSRIYVFDVEGEKMWTILRPGAIEFIEFAVRYFRVVSVWSAGQKSYVEAIVNILFPPHMSRPALVFHWDDCARDRPPCPDDQCDIKYKALIAASPSNPDQVYEFSKPLIEMARHYARGGDVDSKKENNPLARMIILDDRNDIAKHNPHNLIQIPAYEPSLTVGSLSAPDTALDDLAKWLMRPETIKTSDVRSLDKSRIFSL